jgi:hypothetical protein
MFHVSVLLVDAAALLRRAALRVTICKAESQDFNDVRSRSIRIAGIVRAMRGSFLRGSMLAFAVMCAMTNQRA